MKTIRNNNLLRVMVWLLFFISHIYIAFTFIAHPKADVDDKEVAGEAYYISASNVSFWSERTKTEKSFSQPLVICLLFAGSIFLTQDFTVVYRRLCLVYSHLVRIYSFSPSYLINRVLII